MKNQRTPKKFVGLHAHSLSIGDSIGLPKDHIDFAIENGMDALALTDHGHMNGYSHQYLHWKKLQKKGINFKAIPGVEAYLVDSLEDWQTLYNERKEEKERLKWEKKQAKKEAARSKKVTIGDELAETKAELDELTTGGTVVEDEEASKRRKFKDPLSKRSHIVLLPKNQDGLYAIFQMISESYAKGFYRFPRIDIPMLRKYAKGNVIVSTACVGGRLASIVFDHQEEEDWNLWAPTDKDFELIQGKLATKIYEFQEALGGEDNFFLELQFNKLNPQHLVNQHLIEASKRTSSELIVTCDSHYSRPEHWQEREIYKAMAWMSIQKDDFDKSSLPQTKEDLKCELYPKNAEQVWDTYKRTTDGKGWEFYDDSVICDAIERSYEIAHERIGDIHPDMSVRLPTLAKIVGKTEEEKLVERFSSEGLDEDDISFKALKEQAVKGLMSRDKQSDPVYIARLREELQVVRDLKFSKYFLTYGKIMEICGKHMLLGNARGSAGGSLLAYVLGVTQMDPIQYGLLFERFLTRKKLGFPDIDSDFGDRTKAVEIISKHFGDNNVIPVSNFTQLKMRSLIKDLCKLEGIPFDKANYYTKTIEAEARKEARKKKGFDGAQWILSYEEAMDKSETFRELLKEHPSLDTSIRVLFKQFRGVSRHAGGVIVTDDAFHHMPIIKSGGVLQTPWPEGLNYRHLENFGMLKFDILGLGTLRMFEDCIRKILKKEGHVYVTFDMIKDFFYEKMHPDTNKMDDIHVYKNVYWEGNFAGIFQFVQPPAQKFIQKMKPRSIVDIATATSIFRPGPLSANVDKMYLQNRKNPKAVRYQHPLLEEVLSDTYGLVIFQEQLQLIYHKLVGIPLDETDKIRKAFTKRDDSKIEEAKANRARLRKEFAEGCMSSNDIDEDTANDIFDSFEKMVAYNFNKSHAVAYAITSYQCAWLMTYYPDEWVCTYIDYCTTEKNKVTGQDDPKAVALAEVKGLGYSIGKADINLSEREFASKEKVLIPSFASLKYCGKAAVAEIFHNRPYRTIEDLLFNEEDKWRHSKFNKRSMSTLVKLGAFESMGLVGEDKMFKNYRQMHEVLVDRADLLKRSAGRKRKRDHRELLAQFIEEVQDLPDWPLKEKIEASKSLSGSVDITLIVTPDIEMYLNKAGIVSIDERRTEKDMCWGVVSKARLAKTARGKSYVRASIYGEAGTESSCNMWGFRDSKDVLIPPNTLIIAPFQKNNFGLSCQFRNVEILEKGD